MSQSTQKQQKTSQKLSPPHRLQFQTNKLRSKTNNQNYQNYQTQGDIQMSNKKTQTLTIVKDREHKKYSKSFAVLKPNNNVNKNIGNRGSNLLNYADSKNLLKMDSRQNKSSANVQTRTRNNSQQQSHQVSNFRSKILSTFMPASYESSLNKPNSYQKLIKQLNIRLPTPSQKFKQFIRIAPFNRLKNHTDFISHMLQKVSVFFRIHPTQIVDKIAMKIIEVDLQNIPDNYLLVLDQGQCWYSRGCSQDEQETNGHCIEKGGLIVRNRFQPQLFRYDKTISIIGLPYHQYSTFVSQYLGSNMPIFKKFIQSIQIFKIFTQPAMQKIYTSLTLQFYSKGEYLYQPGESADHLFLIYQGSAARKITIEIDKTNKILEKKNEKLVKLIKVLSRSYEHKISFKSQDLVGVADIIDNIHRRSENILIDQDTIVLTIDRNAIQENLDEYIIDRLRKYNMRKYPKDYEELCQNYLKEKIQNRKAEQRKIHALQDQIYRDCHNERKNQKISAMIKIYQDRIRLKEKQHLIRKNKTERIVQNQ